MADPSLKTKLKPFVLMSDSQLKITQGGGCLRIFGTPFLLAGVFVSLIGLGIIKVENASEVPFWDWPIIFVMGLIFTCVGAVLVFGRSWILIDKGKGIISNIKGLIVPMKRQDYKLADFEAVTIDYIEGDSDTSERYEVRLKKKSGIDNIMLYSSARYGDSSTRALFLAGFLRLTLEDSSSDNKTVLKPDELDSSLKKRLTRHADAMKNAYPPVEMKSRITDGINFIQIEIPSKGFSYSSFIPLVIAVFVNWYFFENFLPFFDRTHTPEFVTYFFTGFVLIFFLLFPVISLIKSIAGSLRNSAVVSISDNEIEIEFINGFRSKTVKIPFSEIIDMDYSTALGAKLTVKNSAVKRASDISESGYGMQDKNSALFKLIDYLSRFAVSKGIVIKTKKDVITFGDGLADDEIRYIFSTITRNFR
jgi:hypothetical protein